MSFIFLSLCQNNTNTLYAIPPVAGAGSYIWVLAPGNAGTITPCDTSCIINWDGNWTGNASLRVMASNGCGTSSFSPELVIHFMPAPGTPDQPSGPATLCQGCETTSEYNTQSVLNASQYTWDLTPDNAGTITWTDTAATVTWTADFTGVAAIRVKASNLCNESNWSVPLDVAISTFPVGIPEHTGDLNVSVSPNPSKGQFRLDVTSPGVKTFNLGIVNTLGRVVFDLPEIPTAGKYSSNIDVPGLQNGVYYIVVSTQNNKVTRKIVIQK